MCHVSSRRKDFRNLKLMYRVVRYFVVQNQARGLCRWMEEMEVFLQADEAALGHVDTLQAQLTESNVSLLCLGLFIC